MVLSRVGSAIVYNLGPRCGNKTEERIITLNGALITLHTKSQIAQLLWEDPNPPSPVPSLPGPLTPLAHLALEYHVAFRGVDGVTDQGS